MLMQLHIQYLKDMLSIKLLYKLSHHVRNYIERTNFHQRNMSYMHMLLIKKRTIRKFRLELIFWRHL